jgi:membrane protein DedA with SNARE-associated domain
LIGILLPGATFLLAASALIPMGVVDAWTMILWVIPGAILGDVIAYWLGRRYGRQILALWPMRNHPELIEQGYRFFNRWGTASVFFGRFSGPVRSTVPLLAGMMDMHRGRFWFANIASAIAWAPFLMTPGLVMTAGSKWLETATPLEKLIGGLIAFNLAVGGFFLWRWYQRRVARLQPTDPSQR